jgi:hypothetical protein
MFLPLMVMSPLFFIVIVASPVLMTTSSATLIKSLLPTSTTLSLATFYDMDATPAAPRPSLRAAIASGSETVAQLFDGEGF